MTCEDIRYDSDDGLKLYARDYPRADSELTLLCLHGLTRNSADFHDLACALQPEYRIVSADQRGRGRSEWDSDSANYTPLRYVTDMFTLIDRLKLKDIVLVGTSMGGLMAMIMTAGNPELFRGVVLNDIGPVVGAKGLERIKSYVGKVKPARTWEEAADQAAEINGAAFPHYTPQDWDRWARRTYAENAAGELELLYDPAIAEPIAASDANAVPPDPWPLFEGLKKMPVLVFRGENSDILEEDCAVEMQRRHPGLKLRTVRGVGHAPMLDEPGVIPWLREFLKTL